MVRLRSALWPNGRRLAPAGLQATSRHGRLPTTSPVDLAPEAMERGDQNGSLPARFATSPFMDSSSQHRLTRSEKAAYGAGGIVANLLSNAVFRLASPVLNIGLHISPELVGLALFVPRVWSMITDPFIGRVSDNMRTP